VKEGLKMKEFTSAIKNKPKLSSGDILVNVAIYIILGIIVLCVLYPLYFCVIASISDPYAINSGEIVFLPKDIQFDGYRKIFTDPTIWIGYKNSIYYAGIGTFVNVSVTMAGAYALSRKDLPFRKYFMIMIVITMFFSGGLIPRYLVVEQLGLIDTLWSMVLPNAVTVWNLIICRTFFQTSIPDSLLEAAEIDGCSDFGFYFKIVLPLSKSIMAVLIIFYGVGHWNAYFDALIFLRSAQKYPLQIILRNILVLNETMASLIEDADVMAEVQRLKDMIKYAVIIVATAPIMMIYPFLQRYFVKGVMIGSLKG